MNVMVVDQYYLSDHQVSEAGGAQNRSEGDGEQHDGRARSFLAKKTPREDGEGAQGQKAEGVREPELDGQKAHAGFLHQ